MSDAKRMKALEKENARFKKLVADQVLDIAILKELAQFRYHRSTFESYDHSWNSGVSGISMTALTRRLILRPILNMLTPMQALAEGDFNMHIEPHSILHPKELVDFSEQFNLTAKELGCTK